MKGIQHRRSSYYGSVHETVITIEADESTPLLVDRVIWPDESNQKENKENLASERREMKYGLSSWSFGSSNKSSSSSSSTKSFKRHFMELKVLAFALLLAAAISIAVYLLVIESRLPAITLSLDLVSRDIWSSKIVQRNYHHLQHNNVDHIILMQTGNKNCDTSGECLDLLIEMQKNEPEELPFNFLVGGDGQAYEVRGWKYQSSIKGIPPEKSLVIGIIGNSYENSPQDKLLHTIKSLIHMSSKRHMINSKYYIYGLLQSDRERKELQKLFKKIVEWPEFKGFLTNY